MDDVEVDEWVKAAIPRASGSCDSEEQDRLEANAEEAHDAEQQDPVEAARGG